MTNACMAKHNRLLDTHTHTNTHIHTHTHAYADLDELEAATNAFMAKHNHLLETEKKLKTTVSKLGQEEGLNSGVKEMRVGGKILTALP